MNIEPSRHAAAGHAAAHTHDPHHSHGHGHGAHKHAHAHAPAPPVASTQRISLLMRSASLRLAGAVVLSALLWAAVGWALSGTP